MMNVDEPTQKLTYAGRMPAPHRPEMFTVVVSILGSGFLIIAGLLCAASAAWAMLFQFDPTFLVMFFTGTGCLLAGAYFLRLTVRYLRRPEYREEDAQEETLAQTRMGPAEWEELRQRESSRP